MNREDTKILRGLRADTEDCLREVLDVDGEAALLDFPSHMNTGDSMIWAGELAYARSLNIDLRYIADAARYNHELMGALLNDGGKVLLHGGGNWGDLWPEPQLFRERVVAENPDRSIVQLPQTVYFRDDAQAERANRIFGSHPDFVLLIRDAESMTRARLQLPDVTIRYCPDMAFGWTPTFVVGKHLRPTLLLSRRDRERDGSWIDDTVLSLIRSPDIADWGLSGRRLVLRHAAVAIGRIGRSSGALGRSQLYYKLLRLSYDAKYRLNLEKGIELFVDRSFVVTDRLHAHILAVLMGIDHAVSDNSYGKVRSIYRDYSGQFSTGDFATNTEELRAIVERYTELEDRVTPESS